MNLRRALFTAMMIVAVTLLAGACSSGDSPTRPSAPAGTPGTGGGGSGDFVISLSSSPNIINVGDSTTPSVITVSVRLRSNNNLPPDGATVTLTTTLGEFTTAGSAQRSAVLTLDNGQANIRFFPSDVAGEALITGRIGESSGQLQVEIVGSAAFAANFLEPNFGAPGGGDVVVLRGQGFVSPVQVRFQILSTLGNQNNLSSTAQILSVEPTAVTLITPPSPESVAVGETKLADVFVSNRVGTDNEVVQEIGGAFTYVLGGSLQQPAVSSISPTNGPNEGGTRLSILGGGFEAPVQVLFGSGTSVNEFSGVEGVIENVASDQILVSTPPALGVGQDNRNSVVDILVRNKSSGFAIIASAAFRYGLTDTPIFISAISPGQGNFTGATDVTVFGQGFDAPVAVEFAGVGANVISVSGTEILVRTGAVDVSTCEDIAGSIQVTNINTGDSFDTARDGGGAIGWIYRVPEPLVSNIAGNPVSAAGGDVITLNGQGFQEPIQVEVNGQRAFNPIVSGGGTVLTFETPAFLDGFSTEACTVAGLTGVQEVPTAVDLKVTNLLTTCDDELAAAIIYSPDDTSCVLNLPTAAFSATNNGDGTVTYTSTSTNASTLRWTFPGGSPSTASNVQVVVVTYAASGSVTASLTASNSSGSDSVSQGVTVTVPPPPAN
ncbi:MAG: IPT/TIG domain-containing protein [Acidobacteriota bacterium]